MRNILHMDDELTPEQIKAAIDLLANTIADKMKLTPAQFHQLNQKREGFLETLYQSLTNKNDKMTLNDFKNGDLINKLFVNLSTAIIAEKNFDPKFMDDLIKKLKQINPKFDPKKINKPDDLKKFFTKDQLKAVLTPDVMKKLKALSEDLKQTFTPFSKKPEMVKKETDKLAEPNDPYTNLFGLVCSHTSGGYPAVVQHNWGNAYNLPDWNPHHGNAQIDEVNKIDDTQFGDPLGLNAAAVSNYLKAEAFSEDLIGEMQDTLRLAPALRPKPPGTPGAA